MDEIVKPEQSDPVRKISQEADFTPAFGLAGQTWERLSGKQKLTLLVAVTWLPLFIGSFLTGVLARGDVQIPFLYDFEVHIRFLVAMPLLFLSGHVAELWIPKVIGQFTARKLIPDDQKDRFEEVVAAAYWKRNSKWVMPVLIVFVYLFGVLLFWRQVVLPDEATWYARSADDTFRLTAVGYWFAFISLPAFQVLLLRLYYHLFLWARLLWQVARMNLKIIPSHPDRMGGLGFLNEMSSVLAVFGMIHGALLSAWLSNRVILMGEPLKGFVIEVGATLLYVLTLVFTPMLAFIIPLRRARRRGIRQYGELAMALENQFENRWVGTQQTGQLGGGHTDFRDLANMGNVYAHVESMYGSPITRSTVMLIAIATLLPVSPLLLTVIPFEEIMLRVLAIVFEPVSATSSH